MRAEELKLGIYEKALPRDLSWAQRLDAARRLGFHFVEISVDESDDRLARLEWTRNERLNFTRSVLESGLTVPSMCLSGHRRYPLGSHDPAVRARGEEIMTGAIQFAVDTGVRTIQLAGYDVYYEQGDADTRSWFLEGLRRAIDRAAREHVMLAMEIMDHPLMSSIVKYLNFERILRSPWFTVYPDVGNLSAWGNDTPEELELGRDRTVAIHLKDTIAVGPNTPGKFKEVPFGEGCVDFEAVFARLARLNYRGPFLIEMWTEKSHDPEAEIAAARTWILEKMEHAGLLEARSRAGSAS